MPPVGLQARKACTGGDKGIDGIEITLQVVDMTTYRSFDFAAARLFLLDNIEEIGRRSSSVIARTVFT